MAATMTARADSTTHAAAPAEALVQDTFWDGPRIVIATDQGDLPVVPGRSFAWDVGDVVAPPPAPPTYVFEPRPLAAIQEEMAQAAGTDQERLHSEMRLCDREHVVYAAFYGVLPKVGMTSRDRLPHRLREQGADAGFVIAGCRDRSEARRVEKEVASLYGLPEWRRVRETLRQLTRPVDWDRIAARADDLRQRLRGPFEPEPGLLRIRDVPLEAPLPAPPRLADAGGLHAGTWLGAKGNHLFYASAGTRGRLPVGGDPVVALRRHDLVGRVVHIADSAPP